MPTNEPPQLEPVPVGGRIFFPGSPWPAGHALAEFRWSGRLEPETGLWFDLHAVSQDYDAEDDPADLAADEAEEDDADAWESRGMWQNYHNCILSSDYWRDGGFQPLPDGSLFSFDGFDGREVVVDPLVGEEEADEDECTFGIYLLGHDATADHRIVFRKLDVGERWSIEWRGKIALTYLGDYEFAHEFRLVAPEVRFGGIMVPSEISADDARTLLARHVAHADLYELRDEDGVLVFRPR